MAEISKITREDMPQGNPVGIKLMLVVVLPDGSEKEITVEDVLNSGKLTRAEHYIEQMGGKIVLGVNEGITLKDLAEMAGYEGGATKFSVVGKDLKDNELERILDISLLENGSAFVSLARDGEWNSLVEKGAFRFLTIEGDPKTQWVKDIFECSLIKDDNWKGC